MSLSPSQLAIIEAELKNDPEQLGYGQFVSINDYLNAFTLLTWIRDGVTPCPPNAVVGPNGTVTGATNATPIVITTSTPHGRTTGDNVLIANVGGNTAANGYFTITALSSTTFSLNGSTGNGAYTSGGTWNWCVTGVRQASVAQISILGAVLYSDLITAGGASAVTANQAGILMLFQSLVNQPSGQIALVDQFGNDTNNAKNLKQVVTSGSGSHAAIQALETRTGSRAEQLLGLSGSIPGVVLAASDVQAAIASGQA